MGNIILFGAGKDGKKALHRYGKQVAFFCDNNEDKIGMVIEGILVISFSDMLKKLQADKSFYIVVTPKDIYLRKGIICQLELANIKNYLLFNIGDDSDELQRKIDYRFSNYNSRVKIINYIECSHSIDLFSQINEFLQIKDELIKNIGTEEFIGKYDYDNEANHYGNLQAIMSYAGILPDLELYSPHIIHTNAVPSHLPFMYNYAMITQGKSYANLIHDKNPVLPVFSIGPYIHYAEEIFGSKEKEKFKKNYGRVLTVALPHSVETMKNETNYTRLMSDVINKYKKEYDSFLLLVYWMDLTEDLIKKTRELGFQIVSAGFRFDPFFLKRLKSILILSDAIVDFPISTTVSYALECNPEVEIIYLSDKYNKCDHAPEEWNNYNDFFLKDTKKFLKEINIWNKDAIDNNELKKWWNDYIGFDQKKSKSYIQNIFEISKDIWCLCEGNVKYYCEAVRKVFRFYEMRMEFEKLIILKESVGNIFE